MTNRKWLHTQTNEYDLLIKAQEQLVTYAPRCVLRLIDSKSNKCPMTFEEFQKNDTRKCSECIQNWLNEERK